MLYTGIPAYVNRNGILMTLDGILMTLDGILMTLVASFLLLFTTSGDFLCLKLGGV